MSTPAIINAVGSKLTFYLSSNNLTLAPDMSAPMRTGWLRRGELGFVNFFAKWPGSAGAVTAPTGTWTVEGTNTPTDATGMVILTPATGQPAGTSGSLGVDNIQTSYMYLALVYAPSSAGVGAVATASVGM